MQKVFIHGVGWVLVKKHTLDEMYDLVYRQTFAADCKSSEGIDAPQWCWYHFN